MKKGENEIIITPKLDYIINNKWPAVILAASLTPKDNIRVK